MAAAAIYTILNVVTGDAIVGDKLPLLGIDLGQTLSFLAFWALHVVFIRYGTESIRWLELLAASNAASHAGSLMLNVLPTLYSLLNHNCPFIASISYLDR